MWILPQKLQDSFRSAQGLEELSEDLNECFLILERSAQWRSKASPSKTWSLRWKRAWWLRILCGRILKRSLHTSFEEWWISSLVASRARHSPWPENEKELMIPDTFGRLYADMSKQLNLLFASSKMSMTSSPWDSTLFTKTYTKWVTRLRQEYSVRQKLALHMNDSESLSSRFTTPTGTDSDRNTKYQQGGTALSMQVKSTFTTPQAMDSKWSGLNGKMRDRLDYEVERIWNTPIANDSEKRGNAQTGLISQVNSAKWKTPVTSEAEGGEMKELKGDAKFKLRDQVNWPTPTFAGNNNGSLQEWGGSGNHLRFATPQARDHKSAETSEATMNKNSRPLNEQVVNSPQVQENPSTLGKNQELSRGRLNPKWVSQLMGFDFEKTFFVASETQSSQPNPTKPS